MSMCVLVEMEILELGIVCDIPLLNFSDEKMV